MNLHRSQSQEDKFYEVLRRVKFTEAESRMVARAWGKGGGEELLSNRYSVSASQEFLRWTCGNGCTALHKTVHLKMAKVANLVTFLLPH